MNGNKYTRVPYATTSHGKEEIDAVVEVLSTSTQMGKKTFEFEEKCASAFSKKYGAMVNSGSSALFLAVEAMDLPHGSEVITPVLTFATTVGSIIKAGLTPSFVDVEPNSYNIDAKKVREMITERTKAMVIPNLMGNFPDWTLLKEVADENNLMILEDSADVIGARYKGKKSGYYSDITISSFYGMHVINCAGNGGIVCVNNKELLDKIKLLRSWGRSSSLFDDSEAIENRFNVSLDNIQYDAKFVFEKVGYNLEGSELGAAFGLEQFKKLDRFLDNRRKVAKSHLDYFSKFSDWVDLPVQNEDAETIWFAFPMIVKESAPFSRTDIQTFLEKRNIQTRVVFTGNILRQPGFKDCKCVKAPEGYPNADRVMKQGFLIASHHAMSDEMTKHLYNTLDEFFGSFKAK